MGVRLFDIVEPHSKGALDELDDVRLTAKVSLSPTKVLPHGMRGTIVAVHENGEAYDVEFAEPFHTLLLLEADKVEAIPEATRERLIIKTADVRC